MATYPASTVAKRVTYNGQCFETGLPEQRRGLPCPTKLAGRVVEKNPRFHGRVLKFCTAEVVVVGKIRFSSRFVFLLVH